MNITQAIEAMERGCTVQCSENENTTYSMKKGVVYKHMFNSNILMKIVSKFSVAEVKSNGWSIYKVCQQEQ